MNALHKQLLGLTAVAALGASMAQAQINTPINILSQFNANGVLGTAAGGNGPDNSIGNMYPNWAFYTVGAYDSPGGGLPMGTTFTSAANANTTFTLAPNSALNNCVWLQANASTGSGPGNNTPDTITLSTPSAYTSLALLGGGTSYGIMDVTLNYVNPALDENTICYFGRIYSSSGEAVSEGTYIGNFSGDPDNSNPTGIGYNSIGNPVGLFEADITPVDQTDPIASITVTADNYGGGSQNEIFALSGDAVVVPEPGTLALAGMGVFGLLGYRRILRRS